VLEYGLDDGVIRDGIQAIAFWLRNEISLLTCLNCAPSAERALQLAHKFIPTTCADKWAK
jgi:hypothetical protein